MTNKYVCVPVSRKKNLFWGLILILIIVTFELFTDCMQYRLSSNYLQLIHLPPIAPNLSDQVRVEEQNRGVIRFHIFLHSALFVIASGCFFGIACMGGNPRRGATEETLHGQNFTSQP
jgi:hypothetical protein